MKDSSPEEATNPPVGRFESERRRSRYSSIRDVGEDRGWLERGGEEGRDEVEERDVDAIGGEEGAFIGVWAVCRAYRMT